MKHFTLKSVLVIAVFFIGVSINNSCGESPMDEDSSIYNSIRALQNEVTNLKQEIKRLDSELAALQSSGGGSQSGTACSEKYIDGLYFWHGFPTGSVKHHISSGYEYTTECTYDKYGRIIESITHNISPSESTGKVSYEYVGKTVIQTITIDKYPDSTSQTITEYY